MERSKGNFRSFLLAAVSHFLAIVLAEKAEKRGGGQRFVSLEMNNAEGIYRACPPTRSRPRPCLSIHGRRVCWGAYCSACATHMRTIISMNCNRS